MIETHGITSYDEDLFTALAALSKLRSKILVLVITQYYNKFDDIYKFYTFIKGLVNPSVVYGHLMKLMAHHDVKKVKRGYYVPTKRGLKKIKYYWLIKKMIPEEFVSDMAKEVEIKIRVGNEVITL